MEQKSEQVVTDNDKATQYLYELALKLLELKGSDIFITAGSPAAFKINQEIRRDYVEQFPGSKNYLFDYLPEDLQKHLQDVRMGNAEFGSHQKKQEE